MRAIVRPKAEPQEAWRWIGQPQQDWPSWVRACCIPDTDELVLSRRSGRQRVYRGEWLIRDLDGDPLHLTDREIRVAYDIKIEK